VTKNGLPMESIRAAVAAADGRLPTERRALRQRARCKLYATRNIHYCAVAERRPDKALTVDEHFEAVEMLLEASEAAVAYALVAYHRPGDAARGNVTLACFMLHHCLHESLHKYAWLDPF
jgi:hypothetical protein